MVGMKAIGGCNVDDIDVEVAFQQLFNGIEVGNTVGVNFSFVRCFDVNKGNQLSFWMPHDHFCMSFPDVAATNDGEVDFGHGELGVEG